MGTECKQGHYVWTTTELGEKQGSKCIYYSHSIAQLSGQIGWRNVSKDPEMQVIKNNLGWKNWVKSSQALGKIKKKTQGLSAGLILLSSTFFTN